MAHAPAHKLAGVHVALDAPPDEVFAFITDHAKLPSWAPGVHRVGVDTSRAEIEGGPGTVRTLYPRFGASGVETVVASEAPARFVYSASDTSLRGLCTNHRTTLLLAPMDAGGRTELRWVVEAAPSPSWWRAWIARWMFAWAARVSCRNLRRIFDGRKPGSTPETRGDGPRRA